MAIVFAVITGVLFIFWAFHVLADEQEHVAGQFAERLEHLSVLERERSHKEIVMVGDLMLDRTVKDGVHEYGNGDYEYLFQDIRDTISQAEYAFGNLEGPISDKGRDQGATYSFRFEPEAAPAMADAGFDIMSLANNHGHNWGEEAQCDSIAVLGDAGIASVGAGCNYDQANEPHIVDLGSTRVAFMAYTNFYMPQATDTRPGMSDFDLDKISGMIADLKTYQGVDLVFLSMHWGEQYKTRSNAVQQKLGHQLVDLGVDVVIGHHPHVAQEIERYNDGWIIYSLGNFIFDQPWSDNTMQGLLVTAKVRNGQVLDLVPQITRQSDTYQPRLLEKAL